MRFIFIRRASHGLIPFLIDKRYDMFLMRFETVFHFQYGNALSLCFNIRFRYSAIVIACWLSMRVM